MNNSLFKVLSVLLVFSALASSVQGRDINVNILPNDIISYKMSDLEAWDKVTKKNLSQTPAPGYTSDQTYAVVSLQSELVSDQIPGNDMTEISRALIVSDTKGYAVSKEGFIGFTLQDGKITESAEIDSDIRQERITGIWVDTTSSGFVSVDAGDNEATISAYPSPDFSGTVKQVNWKFEANVKPILNTQIVNWVNTAETPDRPFWFAWSPPTEFNVAVQKGFAWLDLPAVPVNSDDLELTVTSNFPVNVVSLLHLSAEGDSIWTAYKTVTETGIAKCKLTVSSSKVMILAKPDCQAYTLPAS